MVGLGGGAPSPKHDIRLGDIVVSAPRNGHPGAYQYDFGKLIQDEDFKPTGFLNQPPTVVRTAISGLQAQYERRGHGLESAINSALTSNPKMRKKYARPDPSTGRLYKADVVHISDGEKGCADTRGSGGALVPRAERKGDDDNPAIHSAWSLRETR